MGRKGAPVIPDSSDPSWVDDGWTEWLGEIQCMEGSTQGTPETRGG